jgi:hypothetical protein
MILIQNKIFVHSIGGEYNKQLRNQLSPEKYLKRRKTT